MTIAGKVGHRLKFFPTFVLRIDAATPPCSPDRELCVPVSNPSDDRSPAAKAYQWSSRIMVTSLEMVVPGLAGYWIDQKLGTVFAFMAIGLGVGCVGGMWHLLRMISDENRQGQSVKKSKETSGK